MPRYVVEGPFTEGWEMPAGPDVIERNADDGVTWLHSYVSEQGRKAFCVFDGPSPEAIRKSAARIGMPIERISQVRVLSPYVYANKDTSR